MKNGQDIDELLNNDKDFICSPKFDFSLKKLLEKYPNGAPDKVIAQALNIPLEEVPNLLESILTKLREKLL